MTPTRKLNVNRLRTLSAIAALCIVGLLASCNRRQPGDSPGTSSSDTVAAENRPQIAVIPKGTAFTFWKAVHAGAKSAADELNVDIIWTGPNDEGDRRQQIEVVQNFISLGVDAIVLAPADEVALARPVETAVARDIPVVIIDSNLESDVQSSFVATDNREGGRMAARRLAEVMGGKGNAILLRFNEGSASNDQREEGFLEELAANHPDIKVISSNQYAGTTKESAFQASQNLLNRFGDEVNGIFCPNEPVAFGMLRALETSKRAGKIKFVGSTRARVLSRACAKARSTGSWPKTRSIWATRESRPPWPFSTARRSKNASPPGSSRLRPRISIAKKSRP